MTWWDYGDEEDVEGGVFEFDSRLELHIYRRRGADGMAFGLWLSDDGRCCYEVELGAA